MIVAVTQSQIQETSQSILEPVTQWVGSSVPSIPKAILFFIIGFIAIRVLSKVLMRTLGVAKLPKAMIKVSVKLLDLVLWFLLSIAFLQLAGLSNVALALSGAFAVLALAFSNGFAPTVGDTISGLNLARDRHFRIGDRMIVGPPDHPVEGVVVDMDTRKVRIKDDHGDIHVVPNSLVDRNAFKRFEKKPAPPSAAPAKPGRTRLALAKAATIGSRKV